VISSEREDHGHDAAADTDAKTFGVEIVDVSCAV
jgi:hypothetical protein